MSKNQHFPQVMMLHFYFGCFLNRFAVMLKNKKSPIFNVISKAHNVPCNILFTEFSLDKNNEDVTL